MNHAKSLDNGPFFPRSQRSGAKLMDFASGPIGWPTSAKLPLAAAHVSFNDFHPMALRVRAASAPVTPGVQGQSCEESWESACTADAFTPQTKHGSGRTARMLSHSQLIRNA
ncbi:hypothetical protein ISCGN_017388 [Ixodes scapularis]